MKPRHWIKVEILLNHKFKPDVPITLELLENLNVFSYPNELMEISGQASSEAGLEALLRKVEDAWKILEFIVIPHKDSKDVFILGALEDVQSVLDESNININTIASSRHVGPIKQRVDEWIKNLDMFSKTLVSVIYPKNSLKASKNHILKSILRFKYGLYEMSKNLNNLF